MTSRGKAVVPRLVAEGFPGPMGGNHIPITVRPAAAADLTIDRVHAPNHRG